MTLSVDQILQQGIEAHEAGRVEDAERLYRSILQEQPDHPDAHHNLGALAVSAGAPESALHHFQIALETKPEQAHHWLSMIDTLIKVGQTDGAWKILQQGRDLGLTGEKFDQLERQLKAKRQLPEQDQVNALIALYNRSS